MKKIKIYHDNVLIRVELEKSVIILPDPNEKDQQSGRKIISKKIEGMGDLAQKHLVGAKKGQEVLIDIDLSKLIPANSELGEDQNLDNKDKNIILYYFIKAFNIIAIIN